MTRSKHGHCRGDRTSPTYNSWHGMFVRTGNPERYTWYRGITVCDRWRVFANFLTDMGERPPGMTLDRKDNTKGYSPDNCRWATPKQQTANRRKGVRLTASDAAEIRRRRGAGETGRSLAKAFGVSAVTISAIVTGRTWADGTD